ncbi:MAG: hypothetical protein HQL87_10155 [Magnetococcales bacterium]|nr:hypothetical protein [Magnetococcales bacterium]
MEPERELWVAVLGQAVKDAETLVKKVQKKPELWGDHLFRSEVRHLKRYFRAQSLEIGGFGFICGLMEVEPVYAAQSIEEKYLRHLVPVNERSVHVAA